MKKSKRIAGIFLIIWGCLICLVGIFLLVLEIQLTFKNNNSSALGANLILIALIVAIVAFLGVFPLIKGIKEMKKSVNKVQHSASQLQDKGREQTGTDGQPEASQAANVVNEDLFSDEEDTASRVLCRDAQFDKGQLPLIKLLIKGLVAGFAPIVLAIYIYMMISKSAGGHIEPQSIQAWGGLAVIVIGSVSAMLSLRGISKYSAVGNKFYYYVLDKDKGLYYTHIGMGNVGYYIKKHAPMGEKIKNRVSLIYILLFFLSRNSGVSVVQLARMESYFKINRKYHFAEELLMNQNPEQYCTKIVAVKKIKYFSKGCEVWLVTMSQGVERVKNMIIYRNTSNYAALMKRLNELYIGNEVMDYDLSCEQVKQVRNNIYRRLGVFCISLFVALLLIVISYVMYIQAKYKAEIYDSSIMERFENILAYRSERRMISVIIVAVDLLIVGFVKMLMDLAGITRFKCVPVEVVEYLETKHSALNILNDYNYFAAVRYKGEVVRVGMSKKMWKKGKVDRAYLVLRKNVPYCIVERQ